MKNRNYSLILSLMLCIMLIIGSTVSSFALTIPSSSIIFKGEDITSDFTDPVFKKAVWEWLGNTGTPGKITRQDITNKISGGKTNLDLISKGINRLDGIEHFTGLRSLTCFNSNLTSIPVLPDTLIRLDCQINHIKTIASPLPSALEALNCDNNNLTYLPNLPLTLTSLSCLDNSIKNLPTLPSGIQALYCSNNELTYLPELHNLRYLSCSGNKLKSLPTLPTALWYVLCGDNQLTSLPQLPANLNQLDCHNNLLSSLPSLPSHLSSVDIRYNYLNVFANPLMSTVNMLNCTKKITPQYRIKYKGTELMLDINETKQIAIGEIKKQMSTDNSIWGDVENIDFSMLTFSSSDNAIVKVDSTGLITGQSKGTGYVIVQLQGADTLLTKTNIAVTVSDQIAEGAALDDPALDSSTIDSSTVDYMSASSWAVSELEEAEQLNLLTNKVKNNFKQDITREEFCGIAVKLYEALSGKQALPCVVNPFQDTSDPDSLKAYDLGIVKGVSDVKFAPNNKITRQEICVMIVRALKAAKPNLDYSPVNYETFADENKIASWALNEVRYSNANDIMKGIGGNNIGPLNNTSREQGIILNKRAFEGFLNK